MEPPEEAEPFLGQVFGRRYEIKEFIAEGGFCFVFKGTDLETGRDVALKVLTDNSSNEARKEFEREGKLLTQLHHRTNVVDLLDSGTGGFPVVVLSTGKRFQIKVAYLVLELADGCLTDLIARLGALPWPERLQFLRDLTKGVHQMHLDRVVHRDIKSENTLLFYLRRAVVVAKIADLGRSRDMKAARRLPPEEYRIGRGDLRFAPPELLWLQGGDDGLGWLLVDIYLLGSVLFELATGVGITSMAFGDSRAELQSAHRVPEEEREHAFRARASEMRRQYELAYSVFSESVPPAIRQQALLLLRQLTDPDPLKRLPRLRRDLELPMLWDLQWLLRRIDILILTLRNAST